MLALVSYAESLVAFATDDFVLLGDDLIPRKTVSWLIGSFFEYSYFHVAVLTILSVAIQTCVWNKLACLYLFLNLIEKSWFESHVYTITIYTCVCIANIAVCMLVLWKGMRIFLK